MDDKKALEIWKNILKTALEIPGAKINRKVFLIKVLSQYYDDVQVKLAVDTRPALADIKLGHIEIISDEIIRSHIRKASAVSFIAGIPGGWALAGTVPADLAQFYWHIIVLIQKLSYLYGWPDFMKNMENEDDTLYLFTFFIGLMSGSKGSVQAINEIAMVYAEKKEESVREPILKPELRDVAIKIGKLIGGTLIKRGIKSGLGKFVPVIGGFISGGMSYYSMKKMTKKLRKQLLNLPLAEI